MGNATFTTPTQHGTTPPAHPHVRSVVPVWAPPPCEGVLCPCYGGVVQHSVIFIYIQLNSKSTSNRFSLFFLYLENKIIFYFPIKKIFYNRFLYLSLYKLNDIFYFYFIIFSLSYFFIIFFFSPLLSSPSSLSLKTHHQPFFSPPSLLFFSLSSSSRSFNSFLSSL